MFNLFKKAKQDGLTPEKGKSAESVKRSETFEQAEPAKITLENVDPQIFEMARALMRRTPPRRLRRASSIF